MLNGDDSWEIFTYKDVEDILHEFGIVAHAVNVYPIHPGVIAVCVLEKDLVLAEGVCAQMTAPMGVRVVVTLIRFAP